MLFCEFCKIFKSTYFAENLRAAAFEISRRFVWKIICFYLYTIYLQMTKTLIFKNYENYVIYNNKNSP